MEELQSKEQYETLKNSERTVFLFTADWCPDCTVIEPFLPALEVDYPEITFVSVNRDDHLSVCEEEDIFGIPSFIAYSKGKEYSRFVSKERKTRSDIEQFLNELEW